MTNAFELNEMELEQVNGGAAKKSTHYVNYVVVRGDNLHRIANKFNTNWVKIYNLNKAVIGDNPSLLKIGTVLRIPQ